MALPVIDFTNVGLLRKDNDVTYEALKIAGEKMYDAFSTVGFAYLSNTGVARSVVDELNEIADNFFDLPLDDKMKFVCKTDRVNGMNYDPMGIMSANSERPAFDVVEQFRMPFSNVDTWPDVNNMRKKSEEFQKMVKILILRILKALGVGMKLKDVDFLRKCHSKIGTNENSSTLIYSRYPGITDDLKVVENQIRMGEHCDVTSLSMLFQDDVGGLQIRNKDGKFVDVQTVPDAMVLNIGDVLQAWSGGRLKSTEHRVIIPEDPVKRAKHRRLVGLFVLSDNEVELKELEYKDSKKASQQKDKILTTKQFKRKRYAELYFGDKEMQS